MKVDQDVHYAKFGFMQNVGMKIKVVPHLVVAILWNLVECRVDTEAKKAGSRIPRNP